MFKTVLIVAVCSADGVNPAAHFRCWTGKLYRVSRSDFRQRASRPGRAVAHSSGKAPRGGGKSGGMNETPGRDWRPAMVGLQRRSGGRHSVDRSSVAVGRAGDWSEVWQPCNRRGAARTTVNGPPPTEGDSGGGEKGDRRNPSSPGKRLRGPDRVGRLPRHSASDPWTALCRSRKTLRSGGRRCRFFRRGGGEAGWRGRDRNPTGET